MPGGQALGKGGQVDHRPVGARHALQAGQRPDVEPELRVVVVLQDIAAGLLPGPGQQLGPAGGGHGHAGGKVVAGGDVAQVGPGLGQRPPPTGRSCQCRRAGRGCRCSAAPPAPGSSRGFPPRRCPRRTGGPGSPADTRCRRPPPPAPGCNAPPGRRPDSRRWRRAARRRPGPRPAAKAGGCCTTGPAGCVPSCGRGKARCQCRWWTDRTGRRAPRVFAAGTPVRRRGPGRFAACRRSPGQKSPGGGGSRPGPRRPASGRRCPPCSR